MKISTRGRYALKMMVEFAINSDTPTKINQVSKSYGISEKYLEQIVSILSKAKLVKSIRGAQGGYLLVKPVEEYTVGEILALIPPPPFDFEVLSKVPAAIPQLTSTSGTIVVSPTIIGSPTTVLVVRKVFIPLKTASALSKK